MNRSFRWCLQSEDSSLLGIIAFLLQNFRTISNIYASKALNQQSAQKKSKIDRSSLCKYPFTLLEIMVALSLLMMIAGAIGWKIQGFIEKRKLRTEIEQLNSRFRTIHRLAVNNQVDWEAILQRKGKNWILKVVCLDPPRSKSFAPIYMHVSEVLFNGKSQTSYPFAFFSSGAIWPIGTLEFRPKNDGKAEILELPNAFGMAEGDGKHKLGPIHPDET